MDTAKLFLYSMNINQRQATALTHLVGKPAAGIQIALIENAADVEPGSESWLGHFRDMLSENGYQLHPIDLRDWKNDKAGLRIQLASADVIWLGGGNTYYLRWLLKETGADSLIQELVASGKVYAGWSAGAMVAGPTLQHLEAMEPRQDLAPQLILEGLQLTKYILIPHLDNATFQETAAVTSEKLRAAGFQTIPLNDDQALLIRNGEPEILNA